jgi:hypothetical protein
VTGVDFGANSELWLIGSWQVLRCDKPLEIQPGTRMHFGHGQRLDYAIPTVDRMVTVTLRWWLEGEMLHTEHQDGSNPVQVRVSLGEGDVLMFDFDGPRAWFVRAR